MNEDYLKKDVKYFSNPRKNVLEMIPLEKRNGKILEIGAGTGATLVYAKESGFAKEVHGIDLVELDGQNHPFIDKFSIGNIEEIEVPYKEKEFDVILLLDILEHLVNPKEMLINLKKYLKDDGYILISLPNFRELINMRNIFLKGDFKYEKSGILDETHLRFFCKKNHIELYEKSGYFVKKIQPSPWGGKKKLLNLLTLGLLKDFMPIQFYSLIGKK
ncbi:MAG: class I SAM-dependent methyltransferase [Fusobacteriaceae bacterium]